MADGADGRADEPGGLPRGTGSGRQRARGDGAVTIAATLARELRHALDPVAFARERLGFEPDPWQERVLWSSARQILLNCSRQSGKSTVTAVLATHTALYRPGSLILLVSK